MTTAELTEPELPKPESVAAATGDHMLSERVYQSILRSVARGDLQGGEKLRIEELARTLNVSPTPVREALSRLETTGLVVHPPHRGFRVAPPLSSNQFDRLMDGRELIEVGAAGLAIEHGNAALPSLLQEALDAQEAAVAAFQTEDKTNLDRAWAVIDADMAFHQVIFESTDNPFVRLMADSLAGQSHRIRQSTTHGVSDALEALIEHAAIVRAAQFGDRQAVESAMRMHMRLVRVRGHRDIGTE